MVYPLRFEDHSLADIELTTRRQALFYSIILTVHVFPDFALRSATGGVATPAGGAIVIDEQDSPLPLVCIAMSSVPALQGC